MVDGRIVPSDDTRAAAPAPARKDREPHRSGSRHYSKGSTTIKDIEDLEDLTPLQDILLMAKRGETWMDAVSTVSSQLLDSAMGGCASWIVGYIFTCGNVFSGRSAGNQSYAAFCSGVMGLASLLLAITDSLVQTASMMRLHFVDCPDRPPTLPECLWRLVRKTWVAFITAIVATGAVAYAVSTLPSSTRVFNLHFYIGGLVVCLQTTNLDLAYRRVFQLETMEGLARGIQKKTRYLRRFLRVLIKDAFHFFMIYVAGAYIHLSVMLPLTSSTGLFAFSFASYAFKLLLQEITKHLMIRHEKTHVKTIHVAVAIPTVLVDTQIRVMNLRQSNVSESIAGAIAISLVEIVFRFAKVWLIRLEIWLRERKTIRAISERAPQRHQAGEVHDAPQSDLMTVASPPPSVTRNLNGMVPQRIHVRSSVPKDVSKNEQYVEFIRWRRRLLQFHAAEIHADMYAEYLAIVCSMAIYFFFHKHPKYAWRTTGEAESSSATELDWKQQVVYLVVQIFVEIVIDVLSCVWELSNGMPFHNPQKTRVFITALFVGISVTNIVLSAIMMVKPADT